MPDLDFDPPLTLFTGESFTQTIRLMDGKNAVAQARWHCLNINDGVVQILELDVAPAHRRKGHGKRLLEAVAKSAADAHRTRGTKLRRIWLAARQKQDVNARALFTGVGFHHVASVGNVFKNEESLIYVRTFD